MNNIRKQDGFTLIELMIVIAILAILLAIAIPAYQDYAARAKASEAVNLSAAPKLAVSETFLSGDPLPGSNAAAGYSFGGPTTYVASIAIGTNGVITSTSQATGCPGAEPVFTFTPDTTTGNVQWNCSSTNVQCAPSSCR